VVGLPLPAGKRFPALYLVIEHRSSSGCKKPSFGRELFAFVSLVTSN
jgi:hypothetical protein